MRNARIDATGFTGFHPRDRHVGRAGRPDGRRQPGTDRKTRIAISTFVAALPALAGFVMMLADPQGLMAFYATRTGQTLFYASFIWMGIGMLEIRRMVFSRPSGRV